MDPLAKDRVDKWLWHARFLKHGSCVQNSLRWARPCKFTKNFKALDTRWVRGCFDLCQRGSYQGRKDKIDGLAAWPCARGASPLRGYVSSSRDVAAQSKIRRQRTSFQKGSSSDRQIAVKSHLQDDQHWISTHRVRTTKDAS